MQAHTKFFNLFIIACVVTLVAPACFARESAAAGDTNITGAPSFPYAAVITEDDVPTRCGPGTNYYNCGEFKKGDKVDVVGSQFSWSRIVPPTGSFSWVSMRYISIDPDNPAVGIVTAEGIRIYAGSKYREPIHSEHLQLQLNRGDKVNLMSKQVKGYYKIAPPTGAYLWVSTKYTRPLTATSEAPPSIITTPGDANTATPTPTPVRTMISSTSDALKQYYTLEKQIEAQKAKPIDQQNYTNIKKALAEIAASEQAGKAARYAEFAIKQIKRFELAQIVAKEIRLHNEELQKTKERIDNAHATRLKQEVQDLGRFAVMGKFETSSVYSSEANPVLYRIMDNKNKTVCYALPTGLASKKDLSKLTGLKVGLIGKISPHPQTGGALVRFTEIVELN
jgi:uncharacterized protein YgiM (DUF1202 family)